MKKNSAPAKARNHVALALSNRQGGSGSHTKPEKAQRRRAKSRIRDLYFHQGE